MNLAQNAPLAPVAIEAPVMVGVTADEAMPAVMMPLGEPAAASDPEGAIVYRLPADRADQMSHVKRVRVMPGITTVACKLSPQAQFPALAGSPLDWQR